MTQAGHPVQLGGPIVGTAVSVGAAGARPAFDDLVDVDAPAGEPGLLERQGDGKVRAIPRDDVTQEWFSGSGGPPPVIPGAKRGDMYIDLDSGQLYQLG